MGFQTDIKALVLKHSCKAIKEDAKHVREHQTQVGESTGTAKASRELAPWAAASEFAPQPQLLQQQEAGRPLVTLENLHLTSSQPHAGKPMLLLSKVLKPKMWSSRLPVQFCFLRIMLCHFSLPTKLFLP